MYMYIPTLAFWVATLDAKLTNQASTSLYGSQYQWQYRCMIIEKSKRRQGLFRYLTQEGTNAYLKGGKYKFEMGEANCRGGVASAEINPT
jgi:hypothetical protein